MAMFHVTWVFRLDQLVLNSPSSLKKIFDKRFHYWPTSLLCENVIFVRTSSAKYYFVDTSSRLVNPSCAYSPVHLSSTSMDTSMDTCLKLSRKPILMPIEVLHGWLSRNHSIAPKVIIVPPRIPLIKSPCLNVWNPTPMMSAQPLKLNENRILQLRLPSYWWTIKHENLPCFASATLDIIVLNRIHPSLHWSSCLRHLLRSCCIVYWRRSCPQDNSRGAATRASVARVAWLCRYV